MKKIVLFIILILLLSYNVKSNASVYNNIPLYDYAESQIIYNNDGSYILITIYSESEESNMLQKSSYTKTSFKTATCYDDDDELLWDYTLTAYFTVNYSISSTAYDCSESYNIYGSGWKKNDFDTTISNNVVSTNGSFKCSVLFITTKTIEVDIEITCDIYGNCI